MEGNNRLEETNIPDSFVIGSMSKHNTDWELFFAPGTRVLALPSWAQPRLLVPAETTRQRWLGSAFYPAFRRSARVLRWMLRFKVVAMPGAVRTADSGVSVVHEFLSRILKRVQIRAVLVGMPGHGQKFTLQLADADNRIIAYLKCGTQPLARERLRHEYEVLQILPDGKGPVALGYHTDDAVDLLLLKPVMGESLSAVLPPPPDLEQFCAALVGEEEYSLDSHPWRRSLDDPPAPIVACLDALSGRRWPRTVQHGDLAPWNVIRTPQRSLTAIDWEYAQPAGLPGIDIAQYLLQVAALMYRWTPQRARDYASRHLLQNRQLDLAPHEAEAIVRIAAYEAFRHSIADGHMSDDPVQAWRQRVWRNG